VVIGVGAWLWPSVSETIGRLERNYADAFYGRQWHEKVRAKVEGFFGYTPRRNARFERDTRRLEACEKEFIKLGHFEERTFVLDHNPHSVLETNITDWMGERAGRARARGPAGISAGMILVKTHEGRTEFVTLRTFDGYAIIVLAARRDMPAWEERIRRADVSNPAK